MKYHKQFQEQEDLYPCAHKLNSTINALHLKNITISTFLHYNFLLKNMSLNYDPVTHDYGISYRMLCESFMDYYTRMNMEFRSRAEYLYLSV